MANTSKPMGFVPARHIHGGMFAVGNEYTVAASNTIVPGDLVTLSSESDADGVMKVAVATSGSVPLGVCLGVQPVSRTGLSGSGATTVDLNTPGAMVATAGERVIVCDDPQVIYEAEVTGALTSAMFGLNATISAGTYDTATGRSGHKVAISTTATTATLPVKLLSLARKVNNEIGESAKIYVKLNGAQLGDGTGTAGVA